MSETNGAAQRTIYLGMPCYGELTPAAAQAFFLPSGRPGVTVNIRCHQNSLLAQNCNILWCWALNDAAAGKPVDYFAMLHSDVAPRGSWLDVLVDELEATGLDVLSVVVPMKDPTGLTSTAVGRPANPWRPLARLTMREVYRLPETFTAADLGHPDSPLLVNTGCWVCRFDPAWVSRVYFTVNDRIVIDPKGRFVPEAESEDWFASRLFHGLGLKVGATRKVKLNHRGPADFGNAAPWGSHDYDRDQLAGSLIGYDRGPAAGSSGGEVAGGVAVPG